MTIELGLKESRRYRYGILWLVLIGWLRNKQMGLVKLILLRQRCSKIHHKVKCSPVINSITLNLEGKIILSCKIAKEVYELKISLVFN